VAGGCCVGGRGNCTGAGAGRPTLLLKASMHCCCSDRFIACSAAEVTYIILSTTHIQDTQHSLHTGYCMYPSTEQWVRSLVWTWHGFGHGAEHNAYTNWCSAEMRLQNPGHICHLLIFVKEWMMNACFPASVLTESTELGVTCCRITLMQQVIITSGQQKTAVSCCHSNNLADHYTQKGQGHKQQIAPYIQCMHISTLHVMLQSSMQTSQSGHKAHLQVNDALVVRQGARGHEGEEVVG